MFSICTLSPNSRTVRQMACHLALYGARSQVRYALSLLLILLVFTLGAKTATAALPLSNYEARSHQAVIELTALEQWAKAESPSAYAQRVATTLNDIRNTVPTDETIEWEGGRVRVNNSWLDAAVQAYEKMSPYDPHRADALTRLTERLRALEDNLPELDGQGKIASESKDQEKARLEEILRRAEFVEKSPKESVFARIWRRFLEWWNNLFPRSNGLAAGQLSWLSIIALVIVFSLAAGTLAYAVWKLLPLFDRQRSQLKLGRREARVVLGERLAPEQTAADLMNEAEALARRGELRAAIRKAYIAVLCELGDRKVLTLSQHNTNRDYLRALREKRPLLTEMQKLTNSFENHWYGLQQATPDDWTSFRTGYKKIMSYEF